MHIACMVCPQTTEIDAAKNDGWYRIHVDIFGQMFSSNDFSRGLLVPEEFITAETAFCCGQLHFLTLVERLLDRGTFTTPTPAPEPEATLLDHDAFQPLT